MAKISSEHDEQTLNLSKYEVAQKLGIPLNKDGDNGHLSSRDAGRIGGHMGGKIGGNMVKEMVAFAKQHLAQGGKL